jgi:hypothetical protein
MGVYVVKWDVAPWFTLKAPQLAFTRAERPGSMVGFFARV